jgi:hypothetical protein
MLPPREEALNYQPTWAQVQGPSRDGAQPVTLVMALEGEPSDSHAAMIAAHVEVLEAWTAIGEEVLATTATDAPERRAVGFALLMFASELASVLGSPALSPAMAPKARRSAAEAIVAATLRAGGCLAGAVMEHQALLA